ncbi:hypothetical protein U9M48_020366 [Paspalum notatum var. saurae]|uniref:C2 domain-containing protein n=1 Tax=Paspalum notatum var. saurae TaxID=547442 RepID=A0AAQ3WSK4_PASNO
MASSYLVVHVAEANVPSSSKGTSGTNYYVELCFNGQRARTVTKDNTVWNQTFRFHTRDEQQRGGGGDDDPSTGGLNLEAYVYSIDETSNSESLVGKTVVDEKGFDSHSSKAELFPYNLVKSCSSGSGVVGPSPVVNNGKLRLMVFHSATDDKALFGIEDDSRRVQQTADEDGVNNVKKMYEFLFKPHHLLGEAADNDGTGSAIEANTSIIINDDDAVPREIHPSFDRGKVVERMQFLYVLVVKARQLPDVDAYGGLDPFVEVSFGASNKGFTSCLKRECNPEWNKTFAFPLPDGKAPPRSGVDVVVKDGDPVRDELVGKLYFYLKDIPVRYADDDAQPEPTWHPLKLDEGIKAAAMGKPSLLLAIWIGSQADEAYRHAWESPYGPKVYDNPRLWCLRVTVAEVIQGVVACEDGEDGGRRRARSLRGQLFCKACLGEQVQKTGLAKKTMQTMSSGSYEWMDEAELVFVAAQPFFESNLEVYVVAAASSYGSREQEEEVIGQLTIPLAQIERRDAATYGRHSTPTPQWFDLKSPPPASTTMRVDDDHQEDGGGGGVGTGAGNNVSHMQIRLGALLDGGYHIGHHPQGGNLDDTRPAERQLWEAPIGRLHLGILRAAGLVHADRNTRCGGGSSRMKPYCVAKYGDKWVRTRTIDTAASDHVFNEQYTWDVYDLKTVLTVGVFDRCTVISSAHHHRIGKVRIHLSGLETGRVYAHAYTLLALSRPSDGGLTKTGELHLAVKIEPSASATSVLRMYARPALPRMHYAQPLEEEKGRRGSNQLWLHAAYILALRLERMEPPLRREVVANICNVDESNNSSSWSLRRSKANFFRLTAVFSPAIASLRWFQGTVLSWRNPLVTLLMHAILALALWFHNLVLPLLILCYILVGLWNYRFSPRSPSYVDLHLSFLAPGTVLPDELDEEFDTTAKTSQSNEDVLRMRYDRLRSVAGRVQTVVGDVATLLERIQSLLSWRDPRATAIFMTFLLAAAAALYFVPYSYKLLLAAAGFYVMRHPRFRTRTPSILESFIKRLPSKQDMLI